MSEIIERMKENAKGSKLPQSLRGIYFKEKANKNGHFVVELRHE